MQNSISYKDIDDVDADSFLSYLHWKSTDDDGSTDDTQMMSAQDFYNNF
ncbi:hypothetical protein [Companilactobacillus futsaii]|nr:hypothetical protein [Companilactobacillus futsaii]